MGKKIAIFNGVPANNIFLEKQSTKTIENLIESKKIIEKKDFQKILLVSDPIHMRRAIYMAKNIGIDIKSCPTTTSRFQSFYLKFKFSLRETFYLLKYILANLYKNLSVCLAF
jgi:uncharacterized SAM-binding protein YcdF (DUF218 family)